MAVAFHKEKEELLLLLLLNRSKLRTREWVHEISGSREEEGEFWTLIPKAMAITFFFTHVLIIFKMTKSEIKRAWLVHVNASYLV